MNTKDSNTYDVFMQFCRDGSVGNNVVGWGIKNSVFSLGRSLSAAGQVALIPTRLRHSPEGWLLRAMMLFHNFRVRAGLCPAPTSFWPFFRLPAACGTLGSELFLVSDGVTLLTSFGESRAASCPVALGSRNRRPHQGASAHQSQPRNASRPGARCGPRIWFSVVHSR